MRLFRSAVRVLCSSVNGILYHSLGTAVVGNRADKRQRPRNLSIRPQLELLETRTVPSGISINFINQATSTFGDGNFYVGLAGNLNNQQVYYDPTANGFKTLSGNAPSFKLSDFTSPISIPDQFFSGIMVIFAGTAVSLPGGGVPGPFDGNVQTVPYEFLEVTTNGVNSSFDTSQVDQFGFPVTLINTSSSSVTSGPTKVGVDPSLDRIGELTAFQTFMNSSLRGTTNGVNNGAVYINNLVLGSYSPSANNVVRIINPGKYLSLASNATNNALSLHSDFDGAIQALFETPTMANPLVIPGSLLGTATAYDGVFSSSISAMGSDGAMHNYKGLQFYQDANGTPTGSVQFSVFEPFFSNAAADAQASAPVAPQWLSGILGTTFYSGGNAGTTASPGSMVLSSSGVFADLAGGPNAQGGNGGGSMPVNGISLTVGAAVENQLNEALNRGIANLNPSMWGNSALWYPTDSSTGIDTTQPRNLYAEFLHKGMTGSTLNFLEGLGYGFGFDESVNGSGLGPSKIDFNDATTPLFQINIGSWTSSSLSASLNPPTPLTPAGPTPAALPVTTTLTAIGAGAGAGPQVNVYNAVTGGLITSFYPFPSTFTGGVRVAVADVNGDGVPDIIAGAGPGGGPEISVYNGATLRLIGSFYGMPSSFTGGVFVAAGDITGDGYADIVVSADRGGGPEVSIYDGRTFAPVASFYATSATFTGGIRVAIGALNGDGFNDIIAVAGPGGGPEVAIFSGKTMQLVTAFYALPSTFTGGLWVATGDINGDGNAEIIIGAGEGGGPQVSIFNGPDQKPLSSFYAFPATFTGGVRVSAITLSTLRSDIIVGAGPGGGPEVEFFDGLTQKALGSFFAYPPAFSDGLFVDSSSTVF